MMIGPRMTPMSAGMPGAGFVRETPGARSALFPGESLRVTAGAPSAAEGVDATVEAALTRDDPLGRRFAAAFRLPSPPMMAEWLKG